MSAFADLCRFVPTASGTTDWTYSNAVGGCQSPSAAGVQNGVSYKVYSVSADLTQWEVSAGLYNSSTGTFPRTTVLYNSSGTGTAAGQSGAGTKINFSTVPQVSIIAIAEDLISVEVANSFTATQQAQVLANIRGAPYDAEAFNNILINGGMEVDQVNLGATSSATNVYAIDGWRLGTNGTMALVTQQVSDAPPGFSNSLKITVTTAEASMAAGDYVEIFQPVEGIRTSRLQFGSGGALTSTLGFWTKIHRAGAYSGSIRNSALNRVYPFSFTQNAADTWEYKTVTIPGDQTGTWLGTNGIGLYLTLALASGTTLLGTANTWAASSFVGVTGSTNGVAATTDVFQIAGATLLPGTIAPTAVQSALLKRSYDQELLLCKRYFRRVGGQATADVLFQGYGVTGGVIGMTLPIEPAMRAIPAVTEFGTFSTSNVSSTVLFGATNSFVWQLNITATGPVQSFGNLGGFLLDARL